MILILKEKNAIFVMVMMEFSTTRAAPRTFVQPWAAVTPIQLIACNAHTLGMAEQHAKPTLQNHLAPINNRLVSIMLVGLQG